MTGYLHMADIAELRGLFIADISPLWAARRKGTTGWILSIVAPVQFRWERSPEALDQETCVRVAGLTQNRGSRPFLNHLALKHDPYSITYLTHKAYVMTDEEHGQAPFNLEVQEELQHLCLDAWVQRAGRLICYEELRAKH